MGAIVLAHEGGIARQRLMGIALALAIAATLRGFLFAYAPNFFPSSGGNTCPPKARPKGKLPALTSNG